MPWCPNCKYLFRDGVESCKYCGAKLLPEPDSDTGDKLIFFSYASKEEDAQKINLFFKSINIPSKYVYFKEASAFCTFVSASERERAAAAYDAKNRAEMKQSLDQIIDMLDSMTKK